MLSRENIHRLLIDFSLKSSNQSFHGDHRIYEFKNADLKNDIGLDSIELMQLAAYANNFFNLFSIKDAPYLLSHSRLSDWVETIYEARIRTDEPLKFHTSGTSGNTTIIEHSIPFLYREILFLAKLFNNSTQIISYIPSYTIYGFLFTILLPEYLQIPVLYPSQINWLDLTPNTLIVATPFQWQLLVNNLPDNLLNIHAVTAAAPMHQTLYDQIQSKNIDLTEIYGATETAGAGFRTEWQNPFTLFPYWQLNEQNGIIELEDKDNHRLYPLMDNIIQHSQQTFSILGRKDQQIKIAGHLVNLEKIAIALQSLSNIRQCTVSAKADRNEIIIQANLILVIDNEASRMAITKDIRNLLPAHEHPRIIYFSPD
jgi:4-coumarate--CoA ligase (photoactive yellow protein activation family)